MNLSVAISTYNRAESLRDTLQHIRKVRGTDKTDWELLIINNNCTDHTSHVVEAFLPHLPIRYLVEPHQGLSHCRNRAMRESKGRVLIFTDDDIRPHPDWLEAYRNAASVFPEAGYFGGPIRPFWPEGKPNWLKDEGMPLIGTGIFGFYTISDKMRKYTDEDMHPFGANFALNRSMAAESDSFRVDLGVKGKEIGRGEEAEFFRRIKKRGILGIFIPDALVYHRVERSKLTLKYFYQYGQAKGKASRIIHGHGGERFSFPAEAKYLLKGLYQLLIKKRGDRFRQCIVNMGIQHEMNR